MCDHRPDGDCFLCNGRRGLDVVKGKLNGYWMVYGSSNTPTDERRTARYSANGLVEGPVFVPDSDVATITNPTHFREASPTGKPGGVEFFARIPNELLNAGVTSESLQLSPRATPATARRITRQQVDPWGSTVGKPSWTPGAMARETVSG